MGNPEVVKLAAVGAADIHFYGAISGTGGVAKENETATIRDGGYLNFGKPLVLSKWGVNRSANTDDMVWTDRYTYGGFTDSHRAILLNLSRFVASVDWPGFGDNHAASGAEITDNSTAVKVYGCLNASNAIVLLVHSRVGGSTACTVTVSGLQPGTYTVDIWRTYNGGQHSTVTATTNGQGKLVLSVPAIPTMQCLYIR